MYKLIMDYIEYFKLVSNNVVKSFSHISQHGVRSVKGYSINSTELDSYRSRKDVLNCIIHGQMFFELLHLPTLYWFEIKGNCSKPDLIKAIRKYKNNKHRNVPAIREDKDIDFNSNVLYVGKVQYNFHERLIKHFGFSGSRAAQGLQLHHWVSQYYGRNVELYLHIYYFEPDMEPYISILEKSLAMLLKPLIGKHN